jgi:phasin
MAQHGLRAQISSVPRPLSPENPAKYFLREKRPMETNIKPKSASTNATQQVRGMTEKGAEQSREVLETIGAATNEAAEVMKNSCSTALKGLQDYNRKVIEFTQANTKSYVEFVQKLAGVKSPSEFFEVSTDHGRYQLETIAEQAKQLAELAQKVTIATAEPLKTGIAKTYNRAA